MVQKKDMEDKTCHPLPHDDDEAGMKEEKCNSGQFEVGGYQWRLLLYPNGKKNSNGNGHISLYLGIVTTDDLSLGWEVNANIRFYVFDQIRDKYMCIQDPNCYWGFCKFLSKRDVQDSSKGYLVGDALFVECKIDGISMLLSYDILTDSSNGYLLDDTCVFGVEVLFIKDICKGESLSMISQPQRNYFTWKIDNYTALKDKVYFSEQFTVGGQKWKLRLEPEGSGIGLNTNLSLYLRLDDSKSLSLNRKLTDSYLTADYWFPKSGAGYGFRKFLAVRDLKDTSKGYLLDDALFIECKIDVISAVKDFSSN
ncbi:uncharacterized protein LOC132190992 [Corylus avellana]|uniref:uncharacterized protein LOC132190992 n=1 Tax=Corylus avellana TaxID=13451 RepID=UPI00286B7678|nr:uncharacterized protein LOC132190992 [Corylus avellana]